MLSLFHHENANDDVWLKNQVYEYYLPTRPL